MSIIKGLIYIHGGLMGFLILEDDISFLSFYVSSIYFNQIFIP